MKSHYGEITHSPGKDQFSSFFFQYQKNPDEPEDDITHKLMKMM
jgi:hypothetical protein